MRKLAAAAIAAAAIGTVFTATPASAACVTFTGSWQIVGGPVPVYGPGQVEVTHRDCTAPADAAIAKVLQAIEA